MNAAPNLNHLRAVILRHFLTEAQQIGPLLDLPEVKAFNRQGVINLVHACALAGLLDTWGATSGKWYRTNRAGWVVLTVLDSQRR